MPLTPEEIEQIERTRRGVCARCGATVTGHKNGYCPDGQGSYAWAHTKEDMQRIIANLEAALARHRKR